MNLLDLMRTTVCWNFTRTSKIRVQYTVCVIDYIYQYTRSERIKDGLCKFIGEEAGTGCIVYRRVYAATTIRATGAGETSK